LFSSVFPANEDGFHAIEVVNMSFNRFDGLHPCSPPR
jgi:hypothetical protein